MVHILDQSLERVARALRTRQTSATELTEEALGRHERHGDLLHAYKRFDAEGARTAAGRADERLAEAARGRGAAPPLCGIPVSVKDLYGVEGLPTFAGTSRRLPERWSRDAWLVARFREQGAVFVGKTHTVEMAYGAVGVNPHWGTPRNPWDADVHRIPGGSSSGAGVSLWEGSALVALGSDTGGSIRIPASMTGTVGHKTTKGRWPTDGVVPLSHTLDTVGSLNRTVADSLYVFGAVDPAWGDPDALLGELGRTEGRAVRVGLPRSSLWDACPANIAGVLLAALAELEAAGWSRVAIDGSLIDAAGHLYRTGGIAGAECRAFLERELPGWVEILDPVVGSRLPGAASTSDPSYAAALAERTRLEGSAGSLFAACDVLALPGALLTPVPVREVDDLGRYVEVNTTALAPTCPVNILGLCALTMPVGLDDAGMPVGLQLVAPAGRDAELLAVALAAERILGTAAERLGRPPLSAG